MPYRFEDFQLDPAARELRKAGALVALPARALDCLAYLIDQRDRAVGRDELIAAVWGRAEVSDALLNHTVVKIRRAFGDTGNEQRTIRTVPRFGYRWVGALVEESAFGATAAADPAGVLQAIATSLSQEVDAAPASGGRAAPPGVPIATRRGALHPRWRPGLMVALILSLVATVAGGWWLAHRAPAAAMAPVPDPRSDEESNMSVLVLPADVSAPEEWSWLRLGVMDLIARRLRNGALRTVPSESVVGLLRQHAAASGESLLHDPALAGFAALRLLPSVTRTEDGWKVRIDGFGAQKILRVEVQGTEVIATARDAADQVLRQLGHAMRSANEWPMSAEVDNVLQRSGAAMLSDQLVEARALIDRAAPQTRADPRVEQRVAQIELRAGDYASVERRLPALLDQLDPQRDAALRARVLITLAATYVRTQQPDKAGEAYDEALKLRDGSDDAEALGMARLGRGLVLAMDGDIDAATSEMARARVELHAVGDALGVAQVDINLGDFERMRYRPAAALPMLESAARQFGRLGAREGLVHALAGEVQAQLDLLEPAPALRSSDGFWPPGNTTSNLRVRLRLASARADALAANGRLAEAANLVEGVRRDAAAVPDDALHAGNEAVAASIAWRHGDADATARLAGLALKPDFAAADVAGYARTGAMQVAALRASGKKDEADAASARLRDWLQSRSDPLRSTYARLLGAGQAWADGRRDAALQGYAVAMQQAEKLNVPYELVGVASAYLDALVAVGHLDIARSIAGRIAPWADRDPRAAWAQVKLLRALGRDEAARAATEQALSVTGEGNDPTAATAP